MNDISILLQKQLLFSRLLTSLINFSNRSGFEVQGGELWRTKEQAKWNEEHGFGICNSEHCIRLAIDFNFWKDGKELIHIDDYRPIGNYWKSLSTPGFQCCWGGDFSSPDIFHFSMEHQGIR